jgi:hypothetical protein
MIDFVAWLLLGIIIGFISCGILVYTYLKENNIKIKVIGNG